MDDKGNIRTVIKSFPKLISLDPTKAPIEYRTVEFIPIEGDG
jgi:hypothetical protein